ncbi:YT521-B-like domain-containing protein [Xylogone sp. PMI_703]|nr:YT521-B-like domain-containing protein [Xylogone sp. PMI_703]
MWPNRASPDSQHGSQPVYKFEPVDSYMHDYHPNAGSINQRAPMPNRSADSHGKNPMPSNNDIHRSKSSTPTTHSAIEHLSARAAELKAQLLQKRKEGESNSDTQSVRTSKFDQNELDNASNSSSHGFSPAPQSIEHREPELNISELISQYAKQKYAEENGNADTKINQQKMLENIHAQAQKLNEAAAKARASASDSKPPKTNSVNDRFGSNARENMDDDIRAAIANTLVDKMSKDSPPKTSSSSRAPSKPQGYVPSPKIPKEPAAMASKAPSHIEKSYSTHTSPKHNNATSKTLKTNNSETTESRSGDHNKPVQQDAPSLEQLLPFDDDLREWLEITGFHNIAYRDKILSRRRAIAALDAQREKLLAEMEAEERGAVPIIGSAGQTRSSIPPPPIIPRQNESSPATPITPATQSSTTTDTRTKRPHSDIQSESDTVDNKNKAARIEPRKESRPISDTNPKPSGSGVSGGKSAESSFERRGDDEKYPSRRDKFDDSRDYKSEDSPEPGVPGYRRVSGDYDRDEKLARPFVVRGNYRGRSYDPHYHSRGRGRSLSDRDRPVERVSQFGVPLAFRSPYINLRGYRRGGRGDVRYFIVKSFNEANVANCIEDGVWTTQVQNGEIFKRAFETCKNVILVFSINKSRAFQGYARMESIPGSVPDPSWTKSIHWEDAGSFKVRWLVIHTTRFNLVGHLKNSLNDNLAVLVGKDGQEIEEKCGDELIRIIDEEAELASR